MGVLLKTNSTERITARCYLANWFRPRLAVIHPNQNVNLIEESMKDYNSPVNRVTESIDDSQLRQPPMIWLNREIEDQNLSAIAYRVYCYLLYLCSNKSKIPADFQSIGDHCFSIESGRSSTRQSLAKNAIEELTDRRFIRKYSALHNDSEYGFQICDMSEWVEVEL
jgi:hypothetical protein